MTPGPWIPFDADEETVTELLVLRDVDDHLKVALIQWLCGYFLRRDHGLSDYRTSDLCDAQLALHLRLGSFHTGVDWNSLDEYLNDLSGSDLLRLVDFLLARAGTDGPRALAVNKLLVLGRSKAEVTTRDGRWGLRFVIPEATVALARSLKGSKASGHLNAALNAAYAIDPNPGSAYESAVKAIEAACLPKILPNDHGGRLGKVLSHLRQGGQIDLILARNDEGDPDTSATLMALLLAISVGQTDRHVGPNHAPVTLGQARTVVLLAVALVPLFEADLIVKR